MADNTLEATLTDKINELISDSKGQIKFNTHRNRKSFVEKIVKLALEATTANADEAPINKNQYHNSITRPKPSTDQESKGFAVMTAGDSAKGDDVLKANLDKKKSGRSW